jgi:hypothetical protein
MEKNGDINRLENGRIFNFVCEIQRLSNIQHVYICRLELKSILSGHVNYKGPIIKVEGPADDELVRRIWV